ncbi:5'-nucleotidase C-terminal domain-containing protein [Peptoniphilus sp.]|jgi:2',3'-cyclic-nucleotide 2'-phosphodiesterase (5'-nucleotidase family)|uniref:5'-nucleotidase C-terminal domain-containing protein n=1 Tax=Peptoniphilus sp. TaxID=1971214 RepID=UPI003D941870
MKKFLTIVLSALMIFSSVTVFANEENMDTKKIVVLGTSDMHANVYGYSYEDDKETDNNGMSRVYSYIDSVRNDNKNVVLIDNGDTFQGTIMADAIYNKKDDAVNPVSKALNFMKYDSVTLGNHEFNFGLKFIDKFTNELEMPVLAANVYNKNGENYQKPYTVVERDGVKIGIIGITNPNVPRWDQEKVETLDFKGIEETAAKYAKVLRDEEKVDLVIASVHAGTAPEYDEENGTDGIENLLKNVKGIDAVLAGHFHQVTKGEENGIIYGAPRNSARDVVKFEFNVKKSGDGYEVVDKNVDVIDMEKVKPSEELRNLIKDEHEVTRSFISGGEGAEELGGGVLATSTEKFQPENEIRKIPEGYVRDTAVTNLIGDLQLKLSGADVTAVALFRDDSDLPKGDITYGDLFRIYKFDNTLYKVDVTGKELKDYMEWSAQFFNQYKDGDLSISFNKDVPAYKYDVFKGIDYKIDISKPVGQRIVDVKYKGEDLKDDEVISLAVNNYRYSSALKAEKLVAGTRNWESPIAIRDYIAEQFKEMKTISPKVTNNWEIIGYNFDNPLRDDIIKLVNEGYIEAPYNESLNVDKLSEMGIIKDGKVIKPEKKVEEVSKVEKTEPKENTKVENTNEKIHIVKSGEWIYKIARDYNVNVKDILDANNINNPNRIYPGDKILVPAK